MSILIDTGYNPYILINGLHMKATSKIITFRTTHEFITITMLGFTIT